MYNGKTDRHQAGLGVTHDNDCCLFSDNVKYHNSASSVLKETIFLRNVCINLRVYTATQSIKTSSYICRVSQYLKIHRFQRNILSTSYAIGTEAVHLQSCRGRWYLSPKQDNMASQARKTTPSSSLP